jgi:hypothetical protein
MKIFFLLGVFLLVACSKDDFPQFTKLDRLRIMALVVDTPEVQNPAAGTTNVNLDVYLSDLNGTGNVSIDVQSCLDPGVSLGAAPSCVGAFYASAVQNVSVTAPAGQPAGTFGSPERTGKPSTGSISVGLQIPAGLLSAFSSALQYNGVPYLITVTATRGAETVRTFKRVLMSTKTANANPVLADLLSNGASLAALPVADVELSFTATGTPESYQFMNTEGVLKPQTEVYETTWFITDGEIENPRTQLGQTITWKVPGAAPAGRQSVVVGVLRDGRGGTNVLVKKF